MKHNARKQPPKAPTHLSVTELPQLDFIPLARTRGAWRLPATSPAALLLLFACEAITAEVGRREAGPLCWSGMAVVVLGVQGMELRHWQTCEVGWE